MEIKLNITRESAEELHQARLAAGAVDISPSALLVALAHIREGKEHDLDGQDYEGAAVWRDSEKNVIAALAGLGLAQPEE